ncbi:trypsin-related protease [Metarhizium rileyi]|uniref:Trypsin-related protease n=1 Tax=Metarhizium rileyi (strain RCEF 4871) TaxID=1649241 RepID=A0A166W3K9_METRR|nr:trypsin-related protease [Metarhizium rileyi RCEF 4871]TWU70894.1 hypothetical protein ED733_001639 [Metarhizium rileyi]
MVSRRALTVAGALFAAQTATALPAQGGKFIVGGAPAKEGDFPYIVAININDSAYCGGSLVNEDTVVTAAHCSTLNISNYSIRAGSLAWASGGTVSKVSAIHSHPGWSFATNDNDVAVWKLSEPIQESSTIQYAKLPEKGSDPAAQSIATVAGWGDLQEYGPSSEELQKVSVPIVNRTTCKDAYANRPGKPNVTKNMFCAGLEDGGKDSCQGDSGGPIIDAATGTLIGVVSWGEGCAQPGIYGVYTRLGNYIDYINQYL